MLTAYDFSSAQILDEAGVPVILVGDSLAEAILGYGTTIPVTMQEMLHHTRAVSRGAKTSLVVADMPFGSYQASLDEAVSNAARFLKEGGAHAVKFEGARPELAERLKMAGIPLVAHLGLTPQSVHAMGGYRVQARSEEAAERLIADAQIMQKAGAFCIVLEGIPAGVATRVTRSLDVPTIGIGAGPDCDGQVLVLNDLLGLNKDAPKFVKRYADLRSVISLAVGEFMAEVEQGKFPDAAHSYGPTAAE